MSQAPRPNPTEHPVVLGSAKSWFRVLLIGRSVNTAFVPRMLFVSFVTLLTIPFKLWEWLRFGRRVWQTQIHPSPIFIIGHWRSGTTHLHNLLAQDPALGTVSTFAAMAPGFCIVGNKGIKSFLAKQAAARYPTRLIDSIPLDLDAPQEDEFALASATHRSFLHGFTFPRKADLFFDRYVLFDGPSSKEERQWVRTYTAILRKATFLASGRRLVLKNCANTARIRLLLKLFPDARFIHIRRNPYDVYRSTVHMHKTVLPRSQLQKVDVEQIEAHVLGFYQRLMARFLQDSALIPAGHFVEVEFEQLEQQPLAVLRTIYDALDLPGFEEARSRQIDYLELTAGYKKNNYEQAPEILEKVNQHWAFALEAWNIQRLQPGAKESGNNDAE